MTAVIFFISVVAVLALSVRYGVDSRHLDMRERHRPNV
jgi:hypothetical protein